LLQPAEALWFGIALAIAVRRTVASQRVDGVAAGVVTCLSYFAGYTPLKKRTVGRCLSGRFRRDSANDWLGGGKRET